VWLVRHTRSGVFCDFVTAELRSRVSLCQHRLEPLCRLLKNGRDDFLAFAKQLDEDLHRLTTEFCCPAESLRGVLHLLSRGASDPRRWEAEARLRQQLRDRFHKICEAVGRLQTKVVRASSVVENLNSRLRGYYFFFLRRRPGTDYLSLLQFFLNHRRFGRSNRPERDGKSPAELLTGVPHALAGVTGLYSVPTRLGLHVPAPVSRDPQRTYRKTARFYPQRGHFEPGPEGTVQN
jgi:hypothetical protein